MFSAKSYSVGLLMLVALTVIVGLTASVSAKPASDKQLQQTDPFNQMLGFDPVMTCYICKFSMVMIKSYAQYDVVKERLEALCLMHHDQSQVEDCQRKVKNFLDHFDKNTPEQNCQQLGFCRR